MTDPKSKAKRLRDLAISSNDGNIFYAAMDAAAALDALADERDRLREAGDALAERAACIVAAPYESDMDIKYASAYLAPFVSAYWRAALREGDET
jgi:hypothetical protein